MLIKEPGLNIVACIELMRVCALQGQFSGFKIDVLMGISGAVNIADGIVGEILKSSGVTGDELYR